MFEHTPDEPGRTLLARLLDRADRFAFRELDLNATVRGWQVHRERRFRRSYRDPRWDSVQRCPTCYAEDPACPDCGGNGTIRCEPEHRVGAR